MPFSKEYLKSYLGNDLIQSVFNDFLDGITLAYQNDLASGDLETGYTLTQYIEDYIVNDMGFNFNNDLESQIEDTMLKRLGSQYKQLQHIYEILLNYVKKRGWSYNLHTVEHYILDIVFWQPLEDYVYNRINGNGDNQ